MCVNTETGAVWWPECSKETYADDINSAVNSYSNSHSSLAFKLSLKLVSFPLFKLKNLYHYLFSFTIFSILL